MRACRRAGRGPWWLGAPVPALLPVSLLAGGTSTAGRFAAIAAVGVLALVVAVLVMAKVLPFQRVHLWIGLLAGLLSISFLWPQVTAATPPPAERHHIVEILGVLRGLTSLQLTRLTDLAGLLAGLALLGVSAALSRRPGHLVRAIALTGAVAAGFVMLRGGYVGGRLEGLGCNANYLGILLALPLVAAVGLVRCTRSARWLLPAAVCFVPMADTQSRGAFLAAAAGVAFVVVQGRPAWVRAPMLLVAVAAGIAAAYAGRLTSLGGFVAGLGAGDRSAVDLSLNNGVRTQVAELAVRVIAEHPLRGIGYWMFPAYAERVPDFGHHLTTHNDYLRLGAEAGLPALAVFLILLWSGARPGRTGDLAVLRAVVVAYGVALLFANPLASLVVSAPFWIALGCLLGTPAKAAEDTEDGDTAGTEPRDVLQPA
jgi:O-antigen ligase/polysaccharide polymerase Wzy-like membrane protein